MELKTITKSFGNRKEQTKISDKIKKIVTTKEHITNGEFLIIVKNVDGCVITLDSETTEHIVIKALTKVVVSHKNLIDDYYHELVMSRGSSVELCEVEGSYYIIASDGIKLD